MHCGNTSGTVAQTITRRYATTTIGTPGAATTIECTATPTFTPPTASDACNGATVIAVLPDITSGNALPPLQEAGMR
jgi:hypothetical protein